MHEQSLFIEALEIADPAERAAFLDRLCAHDPALRRRLDRLLERHAQLDNLLESPASGVASALARSMREGPGSIIGPYKLLEQIGEGGFGLVFMAAQQQPVRRKVALKVLKPGMDTRQVIARFEAERQALALMDHPNIAHVLEAGETDTGRPYFAMELVRGVPITDYCDNNQLAPRQRLALFVTICQAVQHAHQKGIIHRDIKPSNVLVTLHDGVPVVKVIDFGIAKALSQPLTDKSLYTGFAQMVGTPMYMSPEQAQMSGLDVDTRSDIYSLGVLLYELLTGTTPFDRERFRAAGYEELRRIIREEEPPSPSTRVSTLGPAATAVSTTRQSDPRRLRQLLRGELDWIVMKGLEKDRNRRYETASSFAADVEHYLRDEPVAACPPSAGYRLRKFVRRNRRPLASLALASVLLLVAAAAVAGSLGWMARERAQRQHETERLLAEALAQAEAYLNEGDKLIDSPARWQMAAALAEEALRRAEAFLEAGESTPELVERTRRVHEAVAMATQDSRVLVELDRILLAKAVNKEGRWDDARAAPRYAVLLRDYGVDPTAPAAAAARVQSSRVRQALLAALEEWRRDTPDAAERRRLEAVLDAAEPTADAFRQRWVAAVRRGDGAALAQLVGEPPVDELPAVAILNLARDLTAAKQATAAAGLLRRGQERYPAHFWLNQDLGLLLLTQEPPRAAEAVRYLTAALALREGSVGVYLNLGVALYRTGDVDGAIRAYHAAIKLDPKFAMAHCNLGIARRDKKDLPGAIEAFRAAIKADPRLAKGHCNLGVALRDIKDLEGAIAAQKAALQIDPNYALAHYNLGLVLVDNSDATGAVRELRAAVRLAPRFADAHYSLGSALMRQNDLAGAIDAYHAALAINPKYADAHYALGLACYHQGDMDAAIRAFETCLRLEPNSAGAQNNLGNALCHKNDLDGAIRAYQIAIQIDPKLATSYENLGTALHRKGDLDGAIRAYHSALAIDPKLASAHYGLGRVLDAKNDVPGTIRAYQAALALDPTYAEAHCNLGSVLKRQGQFREALAAYRMGHKLGTQRPNWQYPSAAWVRQVEQLIELDAKLVRVVSGDSPPANASERLQLAAFCATYKQRYATAAKWYREAFTAEPKAADDLHAGHRYTAACVAALAGCGRGAEVSLPDAQERARLRTQALDWLRADLAALQKQAGTGKEQDRKDVERTVTRWRRDPDLAVVRDPAELAKLPAAERRDWQQLWREADELLGKIRPNAAKK